MLSDMSTLTLSQLGGGGGGDRSSHHTTVTYFVFVNCRLLVFYDKLPPV